MSHKDIGAYQKLLFSGSVGRQRYDCMVNQQRKPNDPHDKFIKEFGSPAYMVISVAYLNNWSETEII